MWCGRAEGFLLPTRRLRRAVDALARDVAADVVFMDPMFPLGLVGSSLGSTPYVVVTHGAEVTVYGRLPGSAAASRHVLRGAAGIVACGEFAARVSCAVARRSLPTIIVPPGVDAERFRPRDADERRAAQGAARPRCRRAARRRREPAGAAQGLRRVAARGARPAGRARGDRGHRARRARLERIARPIADRVHFLGRVSDEDLPLLYGCADVFAMLCRDRWGGLEAEGFGIVFLEAAASGVAAIAGRSGGSHEAVDDGTTGYVLDPQDVPGVRAALERLLADDGLRARLGAAARTRVERELTADVLAARLAPLAAGDLGVLHPYSG